MQQCPTCGSLNPDNADVCADCGMELPGHSAAATTPPATPATPAPTPAPAPDTPTAASFDFAGEPATAPASETPAPPAAPAGAAVSDPFEDANWNFGLDKDPVSETPPAPPAEASPVEAPPANQAPLPDAPLDLSSLGAPFDAPATPVAEPTPAPAPPLPVTPATPPATGGSAKLVLKRGGAPTGDVFSIGASATVGRFDPESGPVDVDMAQLPEAVYISRHHAEINLRDGQWLVKDLGSRNGTFVKNSAGFTRVTGETPVTNGDEVAFGNARFEFQIA